ncbi:Glypican-4 [Blomia tropicalis]|nr:Glypican-4 [Blomia tropicalis]
MFSDTYGILYDRHSSIFNDMFRDLELYYTTGSIDLTIAMKHFFSLLYKKMFEELNSQYAFDATYLNCTIKRSFVAIRTFVQALNYGNEVLKTIMEVPFTSSCDNRLRSMSYCRHCEGIGNNANSLCREACVNMIEPSCFPYGANMNREWNLYVNDIAKLANRLKTSFNIELAVKPINIQISEAIMTFQENGGSISQRLFSKCGKPGLKRPKRSPYNNVYNSGNNGGRGNYGTNSGNHNNQHLLLKPTFPVSTHGNAMTIEYLIGDILKNFKTYKNFWSQLARNLCSQNVNSNINCRNQTVQRIGEPFNYRDKNNIEIVNQQISTLKLISTNVNNAYNGLDVDLESNLKLVDDNGNMPIDDEMSGSGEESSGNGEEAITEASATLDDDEDSRISDNKHFSSTNGFFFSSTTPRPHVLINKTNATGKVDQREPSGSSNLSRLSPIPLLTITLMILFVSNRWISC